MTNNKAERLLSRFPALTSGLKEEKVEVLEVEPFFEELETVREDVLGNDYFYNLEEMIAWWVVRNGQGLSAEQILTKFGDPEAVAVHGGEVPAELSGMIPLALMHTIISYGLQMTLFNGRNTVDRFGLDEAERLLNSRSSEGNRYNEKYQVPLTDYDLYHAAKYHLGNPEVFVQEVVGSAKFMLSQNQG